MTPKQLADQINELQQQEKRLSEVKVKLENDLYKMCKHENCKTSTLDMTNPYLQSRFKTEEWKIVTCRDCGVEIDRWREVTL